VAPASDALVAEAAEPQAPPAAEPEPAKPAGPAYQVSPPPPAHLSFDVKRVDSKGTWDGEAEMDWQRSGSNYRIAVEASVSLVITKLSLASMASSGVVDEYGLAPRRSSEKRRGRSETATHFDAARNQVSFSASEATWPLTPGIQDKTSVQLQLAAIARADSAQLAKGVEIMVAEEKGSMPYRFQLAGQEEIDTPLGRLATWHLVRPPLPGSYNARVDVWLSPRHEWLPVQMRNTESSGAVTSQTIRKIVFK
jgi:hypothetical protein